MTEGLLDRYIIWACLIHEVPGEKFWSELFVCAQSAFHSGQFPIYATGNTHKNVPDENHNLVFSENFMTTAIWEKLFIIAVLMRKLSCH